MSRTNTSATVCGITRGQITTKKKVSSTSHIDTDNAGLSCFFSHVSLCLKKLLVLESPQDFDFSYIVGVCETCFLEKASISFLSLEFYSVFSPDRCYYMKGGRTIAILTKICELVCWSFLHKCLSFSFPNIILLTRLYCSGFLDCLSDWRSVVSALIITADFTIPLSRTKSHNANMFNDRDAALINNHGLIPSIGISDHNGVGCRIVACFKPIVAFRSSSHDDCDWAWIDDSLLRYDWHFEFSCVVVQKKSLLYFWILWT